MTQQPLLGQVVLIIEALRSLSDTPHSVGLLQMSYHPDAATFTRQHTTPTSDKHARPPPEFEPTIPASERPQAHVLYRAVTGSD
jgi:hypothetical protein